MNQEYYKKLTLAVYRVTELFPEKEPLKFQIRESANKILADLIMANPSPVSLRDKGELLKDIKILASFFKLAQAQDWVDSRNFLVLRREYDKIQKLIEDKPILREIIDLVSSGSGKTVENSFPQNNQRQEKILKIVKGNGKIKTGNLVKLFPGIHRRTVLRDLEKLSRAGVLQRNGNGRGIHYEIKM